MMGFNAARLEWNVAGLEKTPKSVSTPNCNIADTERIQRSLLPPDYADTAQPSGRPALPMDPPTIPGNTCSSQLPTTSTQDRFVYMVNYLCDQVG